MTELTLAEYIETKIRVDIDFYRSRVVLIDDTYLSAVRKMADAAQDRLLAEFFLQWTRPGIIKMELDAIEHRAMNGDLVAADMRLERLRRHLHIIERNMSRRIFDRGAAFVNGPKNPRSDVLGGLIEAALIKLGPDASADDVFNEIKDADAVHEVDEDTKAIYWRGKRGEDRKTEFKSFENRLPRLRDKIKNFGAA